MLTGETLFSIEQPTKCLKKLATGRFRPSLATSDNQGNVFVWRIFAHTTSCFELE